MRILEVIWTDKIQKWDWKILKLALIVSCLRIGKLGRSDVRDMEGYVCCANFFLVLSHSVNFWED